MNNKKKIAFYTLGCRLNFSETSEISRQFSENIYHQVDFSTFADIYVINSCMVTEKAERKCRDIIKKTHSHFPDSLIVVVGCYSQLKHEEIKTIPGVSLVLGNDEKFNLQKYLDETFVGKQIVASCDIMQAETFHSSFSMGDRTRSFVKIQDGCDYCCAYCTIPLARGKSRNYPIEKIISQVKEISEKGIKEIILTGVNIGDFGRTTGENLLDLLKKLDKNTNIPRIRISSIEPNLVNNDIIELFAASKKLLPHFHIPLQSGSDKILGLMSRRYKRELFENLANKLVDTIPYVSVGTDIISAFPGETADDFEDGLSFVADLPLSYIHVFNYSPRKNTAAVELPGQVKQLEAKERSRQLHAVSEKKKETFIVKNLSIERKVLFESKNKDGAYQGFTDNYLKVVCFSKDNITNRILNVKLLENKNNETIEGKIIL